MYDRIMVPLDEGVATHALDHARTLARTLGCELTLLHVHCCMEAPPELEGLPQYRFQHVVERWDERDAAAEAHEVQWLHALAESVAREEPELDVSSRVVHAPLSRSLHAGDERVLVVASAENARIDGLDYAVEEIVRAGGVPVLLVHPDATLMPLDRILVALDGSHFSQEVLPPVVELATAMGAGLSLIEVVTRYSGIVRLLHPGERTAESAERFLRDVRQRIPEELGPVDVRVVENPSPAAGIAEEAGRGGVGLIAMATHGRGGLRRLLLGSVAESVVRSSRVPVLLFRPAGVTAEVAAGPA